MSEHEHIFSYKVIVIIWLVLLVLTGVTISVSYVDLGALNIWVALGIASTKSALVISFFMHMKYERPIFKLCLLVALCILAIFIGFIFFDVLYR
jgi:cytochrome c oxidase subunit 4